MSDPKKKAAAGCLGLVVIAAALALLFASAYRINETEQAIITQFGKPVGDPIVDAGLHFKVPFIQRVNMIEKRILEWDGTPNEMPTKDKTYIVVDTFGRWKISDPLRYFERLRDERSAISRLNDILGSETRNTIAKNELIEAVRTTKEREVEIADDIVEADLTGNIGVLKSVTKGRSELEEEILAEAAPKLAEFGIDLLDVRFKRINYNPSVQQRIYDRMISERQQIAERFRSEGAGEAQKILGNMERDLREIQSKAYEKVETISGEADATAANIYAEAYNQSPASADLYNFTRTLRMYEEVIDESSTMVLSTDSDLFRLLKRAVPDKAPSTVPEGGDLMPSGDR
jgi:membrane protease subunit HflC